MLCGSPRQPYPFLREQRHGHIVQVSSIAGVVAFPMVGFYNASKFALEAISEALAQEVAEFGIRVTLIEPGAMRTTWAERSMPATTNPMEPYATARRLRMEAMTDEYELRQPGDPMRAAEALLRVVDADSPPLRLIMGDGALALAFDRYRDRIAEWTEWESTSRGTDFPAGRLNAVASERRSAQPVEPVAPIEHAGLEFAVAETSSCPPHARDAVKCRRPFRYESARCLDGNGRALKAFTTPTWCSIQWNAGIVLAGGPAGRNGRTVTVGTTR